MTSSSPRRIRAARGTELRCKGWRQEGILRLLENTVENGERPEELIIYGGTGQAARNWECFDRIVECLLDLDDDETLVVRDDLRELRRQVELVEGRRRDARDADRERDPGVPGARDEG